MQVLSLLPDVATALELGYLGYVLLVLLQALSIQGLWLSALKV